MISNIIVTTVILCVYDYFKAKDPSKPVYQVLIAKFTGLFKK